jgi:hypothetical protein
MIPTTSRIRRRCLAVASTILSLGIASLAESAQASVVAGWDFSQWFGPGALSIDGATPATTLDANYSSLDPTFNAGAESAAFGTMYINGQFGSTSVAVDFTGNEAFVPSVDSLTSNLTAPVQGFGDNPFDSHEILQSEGQLFVSALSMTAQDAVSVVFRADLTSVPETGSSWSVSFGGRTLSGTSAVTIDFSTDGSGYERVGSVNFDATDRAFDVNLSSDASETALVRFNFDPTGLDFPIIDNVALPEPGAAGQFVSALVVGLLARTRRRA